MSAGQAREILNSLLDRIERRPDRKRVVSRRLPLGFSGAEERQAFEAVMRDAGRSGAVVLREGRGEIRHLIERVDLADVERLYKFLGRTPAATHADHAAKKLLDTAPPGTATEVAREIADAWRAGRRGHSFVPDDLLRAQSFLVAVSAVAAGEFAMQDMRTVSRKRTGHSKLIERHMGQLAEWLRRTGQAGPGTTGREALAQIGLEKFPQDVKIAGGLRLADTALPALTYIGIAPEDVDQLKAGPRVRRLITIENLASFNRYVREARRPNEIAMYTGGYPSSAVGSAIAVLSDQVSEIWHWGDIDAHGVRIAATVAMHAGRPIRLHLMSPEIARAHGSMAQPEDIGAIDPALGPEFYELSLFLSSPDAHTLEQEMLDPIPPAG